MNAILAPGGRRVAIALQGSALAGAPIELRDEALPDTIELTTVRRALAPMPVVDIFEPGVTKQRKRRIEHAQFVGWASDREVLVIDRGHIVAVDVETRKRRESAIEAQSHANARVVWP